MTKQLWQTFEGMVGTPAEIELKNVKENCLYWHYVKNDLQGEIVYNVYGDFENGILYMTCEYDGQTSCGRIYSPIKEPAMVSRSLVMDRDDAEFCGWLSDMILCTQFEGCTEEQVIQSWEDAK